MSLKNNFKGLRTEMCLILNRCVLLIVQFHGEIPPSAVSFGIAKRKLLETTAEPHKVADRGTDC